MQTHFRGELSSLRMFCDGKLQSRDLRLHSALTAKCRFAGQTTYFHHLSWKAIKTLMAMEMIAFTSRS